MWGLESTEFIILLIFEKVFLYTKIKNTGFFH